MLARYRVTGEFPDRSASLLRPVAVQAAGAATLWRLAKVNGSRSVTSASGARCGMDNQPLSDLV